MNAAEAVQALEEGPVGGSGTDISIREREAEGPRRPAARRDPDRARGPELAGVMGGLVPDDRGRRPPLRMLT